MTRLFKRTPTLGIEGLPEDQAKLLRARVHHVAVPDAWLNAAVASTLATQLSRGWPCLLVSAAPDLRLAALRRRGLKVDEYLQDGRLCVFALPADWPAVLARHGNARLLRELDAVVPHQACVVLDAAGDMLKGLGTRALRRLVVQWHEVLAHAGARSLWFAPTIPGPLHREARRLGGLARIWQEGGTTWWEAHLWSGKQLEVETTRVQLLMDDRDALYVADDGGTAHYANFIAPDRHVVIATLRAVSDERGVPADWQVVPDQTALLEAAANAIGATVILDGGGQADLSMLMYNVHALRVLRGRWLKILVRERGGHLRYSQEWVLLNLGANQVVGMDVSLSRILSLVDAIADQRFAGEIVHNFEAALQAAEPIRECGYLPPKLFCTRVTDVCQRARSVGLSNTLVRLPLLAGSDHVTALTALNAKRPGDVATADADSIYVFLFACREPDTEDTLARLFTLPVFALFEGQLRWHDNRSIESTVAQLAERQLRAPSPDYASQLPDPAELTVPAPARPEDTVLVEPNAYRLLPHWQPAARVQPSPRIVQAAPIRMKSRPIGGNERT
ncbi:MAG: cellulose biosynthesis protein BcsE [Burkholderiales bacterium]|nr:cellulose biosynthesis protein BcsE [Burkholderiales bacterium]